MALFVRARSLVSRLPTIMALSLAAVCLAATGCGQRNQFQPPPPPTVTVDRPVERPVEEWAVFTGSTRAEKTVELRARVRGYLERIAFEDGATVKEGDLLFVIEKAPFEAEVAAAKASVERAEAVLDLAQANLRRTTQLSASNAISKQQLDVDRAELATAEANLNAVKAALTQAELNLGYTEIRAPMNGRIGRHLIDEGNLILPDQTLLAVIESTDPIHAYFNVSERDLMRIDPLAPAGPNAPSPKLEMALGDAGDFEYEGELDFSQLGIDPGTGTSLRRAIFANPDGSLVPGMFVRVRVRLGKPEPRLLVEQRALGSDQRGDFVLVVNEKNVVEYRPVELGTTADGMRVIKKGLGPEEWIVVNGLQRARPGAQVTPEKAGAAAHVAAALAERAHSEATAAAPGEGE